MMRIEDSSRAEKIKAIGICLVVLGHTPGVSRQILELIYSFHMPLFFFLSGWVREGRVYSFNVFGVRVIRNLVLPFYFYTLLSAVAWAFASELGARFSAFERFSVLAVLQAALLATFEGLRFNVVLWFFPALICTVIAHYLMRQWVSASVAVFFCSVLFIFFWMNPIARFTEQPWCIGVLPVSLWFYAFGDYCHQLPQRWKLRRLSWQIPLLLFILLLISTHANGWVNLARGLHGAHSWMFVCNALIGIMLTFLLADALPDFRWLRSLGMYSVAIFPLHTLVFGLLTMIGTKILGFPRGFQTYSFWVAIVYFSSSLLISYWIGRVLARVMPIAVGWRRMGG